MMVPPGYTAMPAGVRCRCINMWTDGLGNLFCCNGNARAKISQIARRREVYGITKPRGDDLSAFEAYGVDVIEGRA